MGSEASEKETDGRTERREGTGGRSSLSVTNRSRWSGASVACVSGRNRCVGTWEQSHPVDVLHEWRQRPEGEERRRGRSECMRDTGMMLGVCVVAMWVINGL